MRALCWFVFPMAAAVLAALLLPAAAGWVLLGLAALGIPVCLLLRRRRFWRQALAACLGAVVGIGLLAGYHAWKIAPAQKLEGTVYAGRVTVHGLPGQTAYGTGAEVRFTSGGRSFRAMLYLNEELPELRPGDVLSGQFQVKPYSADRTAKLRYGYAEGVPLRLTTKEDYEIVRPARISPREWPAYLAWRIRALRLFPEDAEGLFLALLIGDRSRLGYAQRSAMQICGVYHTVAVSGLHITVLLSILGMVLGRGRKRLALIGIPVLLAFTVMVGAHAGTVRALLLCLLALLAPLLRREPDMPTSLAFGLLVLLVRDPYAVLGVGLQLSFLAVAGLLLFADPIRERLYRRMARKGRRLQNRAANWIAATVAATLGASVLTLPLTAYYFGLVSLIAPLANLLFLWIVTVLFTGGLLACAAGAVFRPLGRALGWALAWPARGILHGTRLLSRLPFAAVYAEAGYVVVLLVYVYLVLAVLLAAKGTRRWRAGLLAAGTVCLCLLLCTLEGRRGQLRFAALDVGQGECLVLTAEGRSLMMDCGGSSADDAGETAARYLNSLGMRRLDALVLSHYDADHCMGVPQLLSRVAVTDAYLPPLPEDDERAAYVAEALEAAGTRVHFVEEDLSLAIGSGTATIFAPRKRTGGNDGCLALLASFGEYDILATGDLTTAMEQRLLQTAALPDIEVLAAGHHGAKTSTGNAILQVLRPEFVLISVGADNRFGHPAEATLERIAAAGAEVYRTDLDGTITIRR